MLPQLPQLFESLEVSTQVLPHMVPAHVWQVPALHIPDVHTLPQLPQLFESLEVSTQVLLHVVPIQVQTPAVQLFTAGHWVAHVPQWLTSVWRSTHAVVLPWGQIVGAAAGQAHVPSVQLSLRTVQGV